MKFLRKLLGLLNWESIKKLTIEFLKSKTAKRFYWGVVNTIMGGIVAWLSYLASNDIQIAGILLVVAVPISQFVTKTLNSK